MRTSTQVLRLDPSLVGSQMSRDASSEESSVREGAGYDKTFGSGDESEDFSPLSKRETSAQSPDGEDESYAEGSEEVEGVNKVGKEGSGNAWRTFIGAKILWGRLSGGNHQFTLDEFFYCYRPHHIASSKGTYHFTVREKDLKLVSDMPDSNRN